jgi:hypothetical protein
MNIDLAKFINGAFVHAGNEGCDLREEYSGRGMFGRTTPALVVDNPGEVLPVCLGYVKDRLEEIVEGFANDRTALKTYVEALPDFAEMGALRTDSMGHKTVLY